jgi:hypothetical protein
MNQVVQSPTILVMSLENVIAKPAFFRSVKQVEAIPNNTHIVT